MTLELAIISMLAGIALGLRYKVFVLVPAVGLTIMFAAMGGIAHGDRLWSILLAMTILGTAVQFGYLAGIMIRAAVGPIRASILGGRNPEFNSQIGHT
jgi:NADH:ubiquinone oxidoreductase subunit 6 (subunit J)